LAELAELAAAVAVRITRITTRQLERQTLAAAAAVAGLIQENPAALEL
jgi:hypothetical protein